MCYLPLTAGGHDYVVYDDARPTAFTNLVTFVFITFVLGVGVGGL